MFCTSCGAQLEEGMKFCTSCGAPVEKKESAGDIVPVEPSYVSNAYAPDAPELTPKNVLTWGIVAAAFALSFLLSFLGPVFGGIALHKANSYIRLHGPVSTKVKVGHILAKVGIFAGIGMTIFFIFYIIYIVALVSYY